MSFRGTTIRRKIVALLLIPLASLTVIWAFAATVTLKSLVDRPDFQRVIDDVGYPGMDAVQGLQQERRAAMIFVANPNDSQARIGYNKQRQVTDASIAKFRTRISADGVRDELSAEASRRLDTFLSTVEGLTSLRQRADAGRISRHDVYSAYNDIVTPAFRMFDSLNPHNDFTLDDEHHAVVQLGLARDEISREDALMAAAISAGHMSTTELKAFTFAVAEQRNYYNSSLLLLSDEERAPYDAYWRDSNGKTLRAAEDQVIGSTVKYAPIVAAHLSWPSVASTTMDDLGKLGATSDSQLAGHDQPIDTTTLVEAIFVGGIGLIAVIASLFVSVRVGRGLIRDLTGLRREAQEVSGTRLPRVMRRLAAGEQIDVETEVPRLEYPDDEIGQVGKALNTLQRAVVEATVRQNDMRKGISEVFVNLARRSQVLLHRQLTLLDAMERRTDDSEELADLFRLDHMTTRMRRHAEGLVILSGAAPSRQWRKPVQLMDVVRAAIAEVEDYERIEVRRLPRLAVAGAAVADLTHLLAELIENAAVFSPPHTTVKLHGETVANGYVLEIDDRGLGLTPDALLEANLRLAETPEFELSDTDRLGLFVVSRLAQRHAVRVSLRQSPYGGTTAVVMIPDTLLSETPAEDPAAAPVAGVPRQRGLDAGGDAEHTFRQWGLEGVDDIGGESRKEHAAHDEALRGAPFGLGLEAPDAPAQLPGGTGSGGPGGAGTDEPAPGAPVPLPRRRPRSNSSPVLISDRARSPIPGQPGADEPAARTGAPTTEPPTAEPPATTQVRPVAPVPPARPRARVEAPPAVETRERQAGTPQGTGQENPPGGGVLPRRVKQANLAPQLRGEAGTPAPGEPDRPESRERSAAEVRDRMSSIQRGWQRGRRAAEAVPDDGGPQAAADGPARTASGGNENDTPEGNGR